MGDLQQINEALLLAAGRNDLAGVKKALESGAQINFVGTYRIGKNSYNMTALKISTFFGYFPIAHYLCEAGANPYLPHGTKPPRDWTKDADLKNHLEEIMKLPERMNEIDGKTGFTPLTSGIKNGSTPMVSTEIIEFGADVCKIDRHGKTPLIYAIERGSMEIVEKLLEKGAIASGVSAVKYALELRKIDILKALVNTEGLIIDGCFDDGYTLLTKSLATKNMDIAKCLMGKGAKVSKTIGNGPFQKLAKDGNVAAYEFLITNGWDVNQVDEHGKSALALNASNQNLMVSRFLIEHGAKIDSAKAEIESFRKVNMDFDCFMQKTCKEDDLCQEKWTVAQTGQEECSRD